MTESNAKIIKIALSLLAVVSVVLIVVFAASIGKTNDAEDYDSLYVEDGEDALGNQDIDDIYWDDSSLDDYASDSDLLSDSDF